MMDMRLRMWLGSFGCAAVAAFSIAQVAPTFDTPSLWRVLLFALLGVAGILMVLLTPRFSGRRFSVFSIWIPAILLRVLLLPMGPSDDVNRYLWEGKLVQSGISPYAQTADAEALEGLRDGYWAAMNHQDQPTAYPPLAELSFTGINWIAYSPWACKAVFILADLLVLAAILGLLRQRGMSLAYAGFYAFNPVVLVAFAGEAHFDVLMLAALVWALRSYEAGRTKSAIVLVSLATGIKWITLPLIPFFLVRRRLVGGLLAVGALLLPALFFWQSLPALIGGLLEFGGTRSFNGPVYDLLLRACGLPRWFCTGGVLLAFAGVLLWRWLGRERAPLDAHIRWIVGSLLVFAPTVHFWYLAWLLPFICLRPSLPWLTFSISAGSYFFVWINPQWGLSVWQQCLFWGPFFLAILYELWSTRGRVARPLVRSAASGETVAVVIPTLNVEAYLPEALASLDAQVVAPDEVIIADGGSTDGTLAVAAASDLRVRTVSVERGRGQQIAAGIESARADWVLVLHADAKLRPDAIENLRRAVRADCRVVGGALGQRFAGENPELLLVEVLNDLRALFSRTAFGDQVQFFHRETALRHSLMPKQPLMEDVESSWRTRELGGFLFLGQPCQVCHRKWQPAEWWIRFRMVLRLVARYRGARLRRGGSTEALSAQLYREYYSTRK